MENKNIKQIDFEIDISKSDIAFEQIIVDICKISSLENLLEYLKNHNIKLVKNERYDRNDYENISNELLSEGLSDWTKLQLTHWLSKVGNKFFSIK